MQKNRIGDLLVQKKIITAGQLDEALRVQKETGYRIGQVIVNLGITDELTLYQILAQQLNIPFVDLHQFDCEQATVKLLSETYARRFNAIVLQATSEEILIGMVDPMDLFAWDELHRIFKLPLKQAMILGSQLTPLLDKLYQQTEQISNFAEELSETLQPTEIDFTQLSGDITEEEAPVVKLLQTLFTDAITRDASDIHIEPDDKVLRIRQRIDGVLHEHVVNEKQIAPALTQRLKLMAGLNIAEKRLPQDGRFHITVKQKSIDVRLSTMPVAFGESVVMRLLDQSKVILSLDSIEMPHPMLTRFRRLVQAPNGMIVVTGPTGSGKTTTLYAALSELNDAEKKIITVEDPIEYQLPRINQVQINSQVELTFARVLRAALRQDPDIIMVGELRDQETASIGLRAAMTGHLVLSTLHTNDAASTAIRLIDMGAEPFLVASSLRGILAQRLVRKVCSHCQQDYELSKQESLWVQSFAGEMRMARRFKKGRGCSHCHGSGYQGRIAVFEFLELTPVMLDALRSVDHERFYQVVAKERSSRDLAHAALDLANRGVTTLDELVRVVGEVAADRKSGQLSETSIERAHDGDISVSR